VQPLLGACGRGLSSLVRSAALAARPTGVYKVPGGIALRAMPVCGCAMMEGREAPAAFKPGAARKFLIPPGPPLLGDMWAWFETMILWGNPA
jgi:hypothetical protein